MQVLAPKVQPNIFVQKLHQIKDNFAQITNM